MFTRTRPNAAICSRNIAWIILGLVLAVLGLSRSAVGQSQFEAGAEAPLGIYHRAVKPPPVFQKNDLILIVVREEARADVGTGLDASRKTELSMLIDSWVKLDGRNLSPVTGPQPNVEYEGEVKTSGGGSTNRNESIETRIMARVVDVLPNGNLRLEARRERVINSETNVFTLSGEAPAGAITDDRSVPSDRLADLKLSYTGTGPASAKTRATWLTWITDLIWPF